MCEHKVILLDGNEESGLRDIHCGECGEQLIRRIVGSNQHYEYFTRDEWEQFLRIAAATPRCWKLSL